MNELVLAAGAAMLCLCCTAEAASRLTRMMCCECASNGSQGVVTWCAAMGGQGTAACRHCTDSCQAVVVFRLTAGGV
jgi:hypothetical protein